MYDELIKRLRMRANLFKQINQMENCIMDEAADAVEELQQIAGHYEETAHDYFKDVCYYLERMPKWIPVTERLPEEKINQNTKDFEYVLCATVFGDVRPYKYGRTIGSRDAHFWNGAGYVDAYVTHWMPLPEPPKKEI